MPDITINASAKRDVWRRLAWFAALWLAGAVSVGAVAYGLRALIKAIG